MNLEKLALKVIEFSFYALFIIVPLILTPYNYELFEFNKMLTVYFFTVIIAAAWLMRMIIQRKVLLRRTPFDWPILLFLASQILSTVFSIDRHTSLWGYYSRFHGGLMSTISYIILYWAYATFMRDKTPKVLAVILSTGLIVSLYGIAEHFGIDKHLWVQDVQNRVFSTLGQPNWLAAYLLTLLPLAMAMSLKRRLSPYLLITGYFLALLFTKSRSGLAGFSVVYGIFWGLILLKEGLKKFPWKKSLLITSYLLLITFLVGTEFTPSAASLPSLLQGGRTDSLEVAPPTGFPQIEAGGSESGDIRKVVWTGAIDIWRHYPVFGSGVETFAYSYYNFRPKEHNLLSEWDFLYNKAHNEFLNFLATTGAFGLFSYCLMILWFFIWTLRAPHSGLRAALISGFLGLAVSNFFGFSVVPVALFFFLWPALALTNQTDEKISSSQLSNTQYLLISGVLLVMGYALLVTINMWRADYLFNLGRNLVKTDQIQTGLIKLQQAVNLSPQEPLFRNDYSEGLAKLAVLYHQQTEAELATQASQLRDTLIKEALLQSDTVLKQNSVHLNFYKSRVKIFLLLSTINPDYQQQVLATTLKAIELAPTDAKLYYNLGLIYQQLGQTNLTEQTLKQTLELKPNYEAARFALGDLYSQTSQPALAREQYQYILDYLNPDNEKVKEKLNKLGPAVGLDS